MTTNKEDYLKTIYDLGGESHPVQNKAIAKNLKVAPSSVTETIKKLKKDELIISTPYYGSTLTVKGLNVCLKILRNSGLWEVFLVSHLGYDWKEAYHESQMLEHVASSKLMDALEKFLNYPENCPHGSIIPSKSRKNNALELYCLTDLKVNEKGTIKRVLENPDLLDYLNRTSVNLNENVEVIQESDYDGPISIKQNNIVKIISFKAAKGIYLEKISS